MRFRDLKNTTNDDQEEMIKVECQTYENLYQKFFRDIAGLFDGFTKKIHQSDMSNEEALSLYKYG